MNRVTLFLVLTLFAVSTVTPLVAQEDPLRRPPTEDAPPQSPSFEDLTPQGIIDDIQNAFKESDEVVVNAYLHAVVSFPRYKIDESIMEDAAKGLGMTIDEMLILFLSGTDSERADATRKIAPEVPRMAGELTRIASEAGLRQDQLTLYRLRLFVRFPHTEPLASAESQGAPALNRRSIILWPRLNLCTMIGLAARRDCQRAYSNCTANCGVVTARMPPGNTARLDNSRRRCLDLCLTRFNICETAAYRTVDLCLIQVY